MPLRCFVIVALGLSWSLLHAQEVSIGQWRSELAYNRATDVTDAVNKVYCVANGNLFSYDKQDNSIERLSKVNGWSDIGVSAINFNREKGILVVAYSNSNIDLLENGNIINVPDIKRKQILGDKSINNIYFEGDYAYLACGFGIVKLNIVKKEISDTYYIGSGGSTVNVTDIVTDATYIFATSTQGIFRALKNNNFLSDFNSWTRFTTLPFKAQADSLYNTAAIFNGRLIVNKHSASYNSDTLFSIDPVTTVSSFVSAANYQSNTCYSLRVFDSKLVAVFDGFVDIYDASFSALEHIYSYFEPSFSASFPLKCVIDGEGYEWIADRNNGLVKGRGSFSFEKFNPQGPNTNSAMFLSIANGSVWVAPGSKDAAWGNLFNVEGVSGYYEGNWTNINSKVNPLVSGLFDIITIAADPNDPSRAFAGSWTNGLIEIKDGNIKTIYDDSNSPLGSRPEFHWIGVGGLDFDKDGNLWLTNSYTSHALQVLDVNGKFTAFDLSSELNNTLVGDVIATSNGPKWMLLPNGNGLLVYDDNGTIDDPSDDRHRKLNFSSGSGGIHGSDVSAIAEDLDGQIWVGSDEGISVFYSPSAVFGNGNFDAQQVKLEQDGYVQNLLETEKVNAIAVDGANRKWIGTQNSGVYLMSADGTKQLEHFTAANSPLLSDEIRSIAINGKNGQVYFATEKGIVSYKGTATEGAESFSKNEVYAYPNPVKPGYSGIIAIRGLTANAEVKISDISGTLVYQTRAQGGQAIWNGRDSKGNRACSGVYTVFCSSEDGSKTFLTKILFLN